MIDIAAIYRDLAERRFAELFIEIELAYSVAEFDLVRDRIIEFDRHPLGARLCPNCRDYNSGESGLWAKYRGERQYWGRSHMALAP